MYATLEEAFGVSSFEEPRPVKHYDTPLVMRGDVGAVAADNDVRMKRDLATRTNALVVKAYAEGGADAAWTTLPRRIRKALMRRAIRRCTRRMRRSDMAPALIGGIIALLIFMR